MLTNYGAQQQGIECEKSTSHVWKLTKYTDRLSLKNQQQQNTSEDSNSVLITSTSQRYQLAITVDSITQNLQQQEIWLQNKLKNILNSMK